MTSFFTLYDLLESFGDGNLSINPDNCFTPIITGIGYHRLDTLVFVETPYADWRTWRLLQPIVVKEMYKSNEENSLNSKQKFVSFEEFYF